VTTTKPAGVKLSGEVTCTGFVGEQYPVTIKGTVRQTTGGRRPTTVTSSFVTTVQCSGTTQPWKYDWSATAVGAFKAGAATVTLDVSAPGFTQHGVPLHVMETVTFTAPPKNAK
jgi:hypothetical protein